MNDQQNQFAIQPVKRFSLLPQRREDYPIVPTQDGDRIVVPLRDYRKFRGDASFWQFMFLVVFCAFGFLFWFALTKPPVTVKEPFVVEKQVPVVVPGKCVMFCSK